MALHNENGVPNRGTTDAVRVGQGALRPPEIYVGYCFMFKFEKQVYIFLNEETYG